MVKFLNDGCIIFYVKHKKYNVKIRFMYWNIIRYLSISLGVLFGAMVLFFISTLFGGWFSAWLAVPEGLSGWALGHFLLGIGTVSITGFLMARFTKLACSGRSFSKENIHLLKAIIVVLLLYHVSHLVQWDDGVSYMLSGPVQGDVPGPDNNMIRISIDGLMGIYTVLLLTLISSLMVRGRQLEIENKQYI